MDLKYPKPLTIYWVSTTDSLEFTLLSWALTHSSIVALDAEWKPVRSHGAQEPIATFPTVSLLQLAFRLAESPPELPISTQFNKDESPVFLVDLQSIPLVSIYGQLKEMFESQKILKVGFRFKQDLMFLSSTFCSQGCEPGTDKVEPFIDIASIYHFLQQRKPGRRKAAKDTKSLATICEELLGVSISKELQCSDWSIRPLTEEQKAYAAVDAHCLLDIFSIFEDKIDKEGDSINEVGLGFPNLSLGLKEILEKPTAFKRIVSNRVSEAANVFRATTALEFLKNESSIYKDFAEISICEDVADSSCGQTLLLDESLSNIICKHASKLLLTESDRKPRACRKKGKKQPALTLNPKPKSSECVDDWEGPAPWDILNGGDGCPKFLCDVMIEGLAKHLRCIGIDAAVPHSKKPLSRDLIEQAEREKRVLLTRDAKLLRFEYLIKNQIYRVKSLHKNDQLREVLETFQLKISQDQLMSRCTKCNGKFIQKPLTTAEAIEAAKGFQKIPPNCLFNKDREFWQCMDCKKLYWEGTQYHNAVQKFIDICNIEE